MVSGYSHEEDLVREHLGLVKRIAYHTMARVPPSVDVDDLIQAGMIGLLDAVRHYQPQEGVTFENYASHRIRGAILDELRKHDWLPRRARKKVREAQEAMARLENRLGRHPSEEEVAKEMGIELEEYFEILQDGQAAQLLHLEDFNKDNDRDSMVDHLVDDHLTPFEVLELAEFDHELIAAIGRLPERERLILALYYQEELNLKEIGVVLGVGESRVSQLMSQAVLRLRAYLHPWIEGPVKEKKARSQRKAP